MVAGPGQPIIEGNTHYSNCSSNNNSSNNNSNNNNNEPIFCTANAHFDYYPQTPSEYPHYPISNGGSPDLCPAHTQLCTVHGDYGPLAVPLVSGNNTAAMTVPVQVPTGHVVQPIMDESGALRHLILSQHPTMVPLPPHFGTGAAGNTNQTPQTFYPPTAIPPPFPSQFGQNGPIPRRPPPILSHMQSMVSQPVIGSERCSQNTVVEASNQTKSTIIIKNNNHSMMHKDERTQRQYIKLKRKLEQKRRNESNIISSNKKELINGSCRVGRKGHCNNNIHLQESAQEEEDIAYYALITEFLSNVSPPQVTMLSNQNALVDWKKPENKKSDISEIAELAELFYEVLLSDKGKEGCYKCIYNGPSLNCKICDLKPATEYSVCLQVHLDELTGNPSDPVVFNTLPTAPDKPQAPMLVSRTRNSLQLKWHAPIDNGRKILFYVLEVENVQGDFMQICKAKVKQYCHTKLQPSTGYTFRLAAVNECGMSEYSNLVYYVTAGLPPPKPKAVTLVKAGVKSLHIRWEKRTTDDSFTLQMKDDSSGHGFLPVYTGNDVEYLCEGLTRYTWYKFRLKADNESGSSQFSDEINFKTLPDKPSCPTHLQVKGRPLPHKLNMKWSPPSNNGGAMITNYSLEIDDASGFKIAHIGKETEGTCERLFPGTTYYLRVCCESAGGKSDYSEVISVTTDAVCPGQCAPPRSHIKPRCHSITVTWDYPENGGATITESELRLSEPLVENERICYKGKETECTIPDLLPGKDYIVQIRCCNRIGYGPWSDKLLIKTAPGPPATPDEPYVTWKSANIATVSWSIPVSNGSDMMEYKLDMSQGASNPLQFTNVYNGPANIYEVKNLTPATVYHFRVQAFNQIGYSKHSAITTTSSPPSVPGMINGLCYESTCSSIQIKWDRPIPNGAEINRYAVEISSDRSIETTQEECFLDNLPPGVIYRIRVRGENSCGWSQWSNALKVSTKPLPPLPPILECPTVGCNYLKLKWGDNKNINNIHYTVIMDNSHIGGPNQIVYQGTAQTCKITRLQEQTTYMFFITAANSSGRGPPSEIMQFKTAAAPPPPVKAPKISDITQNGCTLEWSASRSKYDPIIYCVQISRIRQQEYKQAYRGTNTKITLNNLEPKAEYSVRVCPIRQAASGDISGTFSTSTIFVTLASSEPVKIFTNEFLPVNSNTEIMKRDNAQIATIVLLIVFVLFGVICAVFISQFASNNFK